MQQISPSSEGTNTSTSTASTPAVVQYHVVWEKLEQSLTDYTSAYGPIKDVRRLCRYIAQVVSGLSYLHQKNPRMERI